MRLSLVFVTPTFHNGGEEERRHFLFPAVALDEGGSVCSRPHRYTLQFQKSYYEVVIPLRSTSFRPSLFPPPPFLLLLTSYLDPFIFKKFTPLRLIPFSYRSHLRLQSAASSPDETSAAVEGQLTLQRQYEYERRPMAACWPRLRSRFNSHKLFIIVFSLLNHKGPEHRAHFALIFCTINFRIDLRASSLSKPQSSSSK